MNGHLNMSSKIYETLSYNVPNYITILLCNEIYDHLLTHLLF